MIETRFKQTEIGLFPRDWKIDKIGNLTDVFSGGTPSTSNKSFWGGMIPWMNSGELNLKFVYDVEGRITEKGLKSSSTHWIPEQCVLIGLAGQGKTRGTAAINMIPLCTNQSIAAIYSSGKFVSLFLYYYIDSIYEDLRGMSGGDEGRGGLTKAIIKGISVPLPGIMEQQNIASALFDIDSLIEALDKLIAKKEAVKQGAMQQLLTGRKRLPGFSGPWTEKEMGNIGICYNGLSGKAKEDFGIGNCLYITFLNVLNNPILDVNMFEKVRVGRSEKQNKAQKYDLFFNTSSETPEEVGICSVLLSDVEDLYVNSFCFGFRTTDNQVYPLYLAYYFRSKKGRDLMSVLAQGITRYNISKKSFNSGKIFIPSSIIEQRAIAEVLTDMDNEIEALRKKKEKYEKIKQGMMQQLLTGRIRLIDPVSVGVE